MRVLPLENEAVNECWIADRDRFSYEALNSDARLTKPMIKQGGQWQAVDWTHRARLRRRRPEARQGRVRRRRHRRARHAARPVEEMHLLAKLVRGLGSENVDHRLRHADFANAARPAARAGSARRSRRCRSSTARSSIGSFLRKDHPLFAQRLRQAARRGAQVHSLHAVHDDWLMPVASASRRRPSGWPQALAAVAAAVAAAKGIAAPAAATPSDAARRSPTSLLARRAQGRAARQRRRAASAGRRAAGAGAVDRRRRPAPRVGYLGEAGNSVGAQLVGALPRRRRAERRPDADAADEGAAAAERRAGARRRRRGRGRAGAGRRRPGRRADAVQDAAVDIADVLLPIAPFTETAGTFVNAEGRVQSFHGVVKPLGERARPGRCCACSATCSACAASSTRRADEVRAEALGDAGAIAARLDNARRRRRGERAAAGAAACSASPTCRSTPPTCSCAARRRCSSPPMRRRPWSACRPRCGTNSACSDGSVMSCRRDGASCCRRARSDAAPKAVRSRRPRRTRWRRCSARSRWSGARLTHVRLAAQLARASGVADAVAGASGA